MVLWRFVGISPLNSGLLEVFPDAGKNLESCHCGPYTQAKN